MKKTFCIIGIVLASLVGIIGGAGALLQIPAIQTRVVGIAAQKLSALTGSEVSIGHVHLHALHHLNIDRIYMSDQQSDTLLYVAQMKADFFPEQLFSKRLNIASLQLTNPYIRVTTLSDSTLSCQFLLDLFKKDTTNQPFPLRVNVDALAFDGMRIAYNQYQISPLSLSLSLPVFSNDSLDIYLHHLGICAQIDQLDASLEATIHGTMDSITAEQIRFVYRGEQLFRGNVSVLHPMAPDSLYVSAECEDLFCHSRLLQDLLSQLTHQPQVLPDMAHKLGKVHYHGDLKGSLSGLYLRGSFLTDIGSLSVNGFAASDSSMTQLSFRGDVSSPRFQLGRLMAQKDLGRIAFRCHGEAGVNVHGDSLSNFKCKGNGTISLLEYKGYTYRSICIDGTYEDKEIDGMIQVEDSNVNAALRGLVNLDPETRHFDVSLHVDHLQPAELNLMSQYPDLSIHMNAYVSVEAAGDTKKLVDNLMGYVILDSIYLRRDNDSLQVEELKLLLDREEHSTQVRLQSDLCTMSFTGDYLIVNMPQTLKRFLGLYLPSVGSKAPLGNRSPNDIDFYVYLREIDQLTSFFDWNISVPLYPTMKGFIHESTMQMGLQAFVPKIGMENNGFNMEELAFSLSNRNDKLEMAIHSTNHFPQYIPAFQRMGDVHTSITATAIRDSLDLVFHYENTDSLRNQGDLHIATTFDRWSGKPEMAVHLYPTTLQLNDTIWTLSDSRITYAQADSSLSIEHFSLSSSTQSIEANGMAASQASDSLYIAFNHFDINYILGFLGANKAISVQGEMTGWAKGYALTSTPMLEAHVELPNGGLNGVSLGNVWANAYLDRELGQMVITGEGSDSTRTIVHVDGKVIPKEKFWELQIACDSVDLGLVDFWTNKVIANPGGRGYGHVRVFGKNYQTWVSAQVYGKDAHVTIPQIGATIYFSDSVFLDSCSIRFPHIPIHDAEGNTGTFNGVIRHNQFQHMEFDLSATLKNMLAVNLPTVAGSSFSGQVHASGNAHITGNDYGTNIEVNATTEPHSKFILSVNSASTAASTTSFLTFTHKDTANNELLELLRKTTPVQTSHKEHRSTAPKSRTNISLRISVTPATDIQLAMGGDDGIIGRGEGDIRLDYNDGTGDMHMFGTYALQTGKFNFTLGNLVRRQFEIAEGSRVIWDGKPAEPIVDITAKYHLTASLRDLFGSETQQLSTNRTSVPVDVVLHMSDRLFNPILSFAIDLPQSDESIQSQVNSVISTDEMLMREVINLLVFNCFYTPEYMQSTGSQGLNDAYSLVSSTISGQINSWISKLTDIFTMGFNIRTDGQGETASQEYEAKFSITPIRRLLINGNFGYRYNDLSNRPFFGDLDIEYMLTEDGKFRLKAYTHTVDKYSLKQANMVQGVGLVYTYDFNWGQLRKDSVLYKKPKQKKITKDKQ